MLTKPQLSVCLVLYHAAPTVLDTVRCLKASGVPFELFVVDNSPKDGMAAQIAAILPEAHILPQERNLGFGRGNNVVLPYLRSRYHLLLNPDVTFEPGLLERMIAYMNAHPQTIILTPRVFNPDGTEQFLPKKQPTVRYLLGGRLESLGKPFSRWRREFTLADTSISVPTEVQFATGCFLLIRTHAFVQRLKGFDPRFFLYQEDSDLSRRAMEIGEITYHPDFRITHAWARENTRTLRGNLRQIVSVFKFFGKWGLKW